MIDLYYINKHGHRRRLGHHPGSCFSIRRLRKDLAVKGRLTGEQDKRECLQESGLWAALTLC